MILGTEWNLILENIGVSMNGDTPNGWSVRENLIKMDEFGVPPLWKPPHWGK